MTIHATLYECAHATAPTRRDTFDTWDEFADALADLVNVEAPSKAECPYWGPYSLQGDTRNDANVPALSCLVTDLDSVADVERDVLAPLRAAGIESLVYESPTSTDDAPRVRIVTPTTRAIAREECKHTRLAFAEALGLKPGCGADGVLPASIGFYAGRVRGTRPRKVWRVNGEAMPVEILMAAPLTHKWGKRTKNQRGDPSDNGESRGRLAGSIPDRSTITPSHSDRVLELAARIEDRWLAGDRELDNFEKAFYGWLRGAGWSRGEIAGLVDVLDQREPDAAKRREHARKARDAAKLTGPSEAVRAWFGDEWEWVDEHVSASRRAPRQTPPASATADTAFILVARSDPGHVLLWEHEKGHQPVAPSNLRLRVTELNTPVPLFEKGRALPATTIIERAGKTFGRAVYDFASRVSVYEPHEDRVLVGYPVRVPHAVYDREVDAWLRALFGDSYTRGLQWIASCSQTNIRRLAAALCLVGEKDVGKSLFADAVVGLWGEVEPPPAELLARQFNGDLARCPVVFDDEAQLAGSKTLSTKRFRELVQSTERSIERKGRERFQLRGAVRLIVACNGLEDLKFTDVTGPDVVDAVSDRLLVVNVEGRGPRCRAALARLRIPGGWECDLPRIVSHFAHVAETTALPEERFIGHGGGAEAVLAGHAASEPALWDTLRAWLDTGNAKSPWCVHDGALCVNAQRLAEWLDTTPGTRGQGWDVARVLRAIRPFSTGMVRPRDGAERPRLMSLDAERVAEATLDDEGALELAARLTPKRRE